MEQRAAQPRVDREVREIAMQCLAIPDDPQLRPPVPFRCSHVPSRVRLPHISELVRRPQELAALCRAPSLIADVLASVPSAPSWHRNAHCNEGKPAAGGGVHGEGAERAETVERPDGASVHAGKAVGPSSEARPRAEASKPLGNGK